MSWISLAFISINLFALGSIFDKYFCSKKFKNVYSYMLTANLLSLIYVIALTSVTKYENLSGWPLFATIISGPIFFLQWLLLYKALSTAEVSRVAVVLNIAPVFTASLAAIFLNEAITSAKLLAILTIITGAAICSYEKKGGKFKLNTAYIYVILAALTAAIGANLSKFAISQINPYAVFTISFYAGLPFVLLLLFKKNILIEVKKNLASKKTFITLLIARLFTFSAITLFYLAIAKGPVSLVAAINGSGPVFIFIYSIIFTLFFPKIIKEKITPVILTQKALAIILIIIGVIIIRQ